MSGYSQIRLDLLAQLLAMKADVLRGRPWTLDPGRLRFKHGESLSELKLPYHMGGKDKTFRLDLFIAESVEKEIATLVLKSVPYVDSAILANWLGSEGYGRKFVKWVFDYFGKMMQEEARTEGEEPTAYLALLAPL